MNALTERMVAQVAILGSLAKDPDQFAISMEFTNMATKFANWYDRFSGQHVYVSNRDKYVLATLVDKGVKHSIWFYK